MNAALIQLAVGFVALYMGAKWLIAGASDIGLKAGLSKAFVGLTLVALGTSAPEFIVNVLAAMRGHAALALSNVAGSNLTNLCVGFGLTAMVTTMTVKRRMFAVDLALCCLAPILVVCLIFMTPQRALPYWSLAPFGAVLLLYLRSLKRRSRDLEATQNPDATYWKSFGSFGLGIAVLYLGGEFVLKAAVAIAKDLRWSEDIIGLTIVAIGTSIPDVAASLIAAKRGEHAIAVGNLLGSNISNIFFVLGGTLLAAGHSLPASRSNVMDYVVLSLFSMIFLAVTLSTQRVSRITGIPLFIGFTLYISSRIFGFL